MMDKKEIVNLLLKEFDSVYCDNCRWVMGEDDACGNCHRKYSGWSISEDTANYLANAIVAQGKVVEWQNDSPDIQPKTGRWFGTVCSACGESTSFYYDCDYCPNCGAKMEGETE